MDKSVAAWMLLDAAVKSHQKNAILEKKMEGHPGLDDCTHPPLTKAGRRDRRKFCDICFKQYTDHQHEQMTLEYQWGGAWELLEQAGIL